MKLEKQKMNNNTAKFKNHIKINDNFSATVFISILILVYNSWFQ